MKRFILTFLILFICSNSQATVVTSAYVTADDVTVTQLEENRVALTNGINSFDGGLIVDGSITSDKLDANANPENRWNEGFNDFVFTGLTIPTSASLSSTTASGTLYMNGVRVLKDATAHTYTASKHTYVDLSDNGTYTYSEVAIDASEPSVATDSLRLARVSTDSTTVLSVRDDRVTSITLEVGSVALVQDADEDTLIQVEESTDEDIIRFDLGNATLTAAREVLTIQAIDASDVKIEPTTDDDVDLGSASKEFKDAYIDGSIFVDKVSADDVTILTSPSATPSKNTIYKDNVVKAWVSFDGSPETIRDSFNVTSVTDEGGGGEYTILWDNDFANNDYAVAGLAHIAGGVVLHVIVNPDYSDANAVQTGVLEVKTVDSAGSAVDADYVGIIAIGDQ